MAPAEMVRAGCLVWVPGGGGQVEIVGDNPRLRYDSEDEAVDVISAVLADPAEEQRLREILTARAAQQFSSGRFMDQVRRIVADFRE
jgi:glycosyltransferase involved in cell wall biosynthesis